MSSAFDFNDYLQLAELLAERDDEASWRSAASRAYYAAYWAARLPIEAYRDIDRRRAHQDVSDEYQDEFNADGESIGENLVRLATRRTDADYDRFANMNKKMANDRIEDAKGIIADLKALDASA